ncbi:hypothetical protein RDV89_10920 [Nocardioides zeae]|uniref:Uncharacterized protein n=1 Tax=Nocardioides imazamoxiresistens TaxID=3231893 RepID=A0ABU3PWL7_9ACTN|nr:hypothetical protein [Nocardioides zeae]MDT9593581.1 hypothetical protein [Nocardioides zeae]
MPKSVQLEVRGRHLAISSRTAFPAVVLAFDEATGNGAYLNHDIRPGENVVVPPLSGSTISFEVVDSVDGSLRGALVS